MLLLLFILAHSVFACPIDRAVSPCQGDACERLALRDFERYRASQAECGVFKEAEPYVLRAPNARGTIVLVHGLSANPAHMRHLAEKARDAGYNVVVPILEGHGGYDEGLTKASFPKWAADVGYAGDIAQRLTKPTYLMGHSTGGVLAAYEASERPGRYKALVGWDPALNLDAPDGTGVRKACLAKNVPGWKFISDLPRALQGKPKDGRPLPCNHFEASVRAARDIQESIEKYCGLKDQAPPVNFEHALSALCALSQATEAMTFDRLRKLPPTLALLSQDKKIYGYISKASLKKAVQSRGQNKAVEARIDDHSMQPTKCSPSFEEDADQALDWLRTHT